jgi:hypothetical protein
MLDFWELIQKLVKKLLNCKEITRRGRGRGKRGGRRRKREKKYLF